MAAPKQQQRPASKALARTDAQPVIATRSVKIDLTDHPHLAQMERNLALLEYAFSKMEAGVDYGTVPGVTKPFLKISGTERLQQMFNLRIKLEDKDVSNPESDYYRHTLYAYAYAINPTTGEETYLGMGLGVCSSKETKYRYRWVKASELPTSMKVGMLSEYADKEGVIRESVDIQKWIDTYGLGSAKMTQYGARFRVENMDLADVDNTVAKQAAKRARADVVQNVTGAHRMFTREEEVVTATGDAILAAKLEDQAADEEPPIEMFEETVDPVKPKPVAAPVKKSNNGSEIAPAPAPLSRPAQTETAQRKCPIHPGAVFKEYETTGKTKVWAHSLGKNADGKTIWCLEKDATIRAAQMREAEVKQAIVQQAAIPNVPVKQTSLDEFTPNDMDSVDVKNDAEFQHTLNEVLAACGYDDTNLIAFLENNYPTSGKDRNNLPVAMRRSLLKDLYALSKSGIIQK